MFRTIAVAAPVLLGGWYLFGGSSGYSRVVDRPPEEVAAALEDLDIREQPGSPGTDASRSGGVMPLFSHARTADGMTWTVMSGKDVAVTMTAHLTPVDGGKRTKVTATVARGNSPDDFTSPAFRSTGITMGLFGMALESELDELTAPPRDEAGCAALQERFESGAYASPDMQEQTGLKDAIGDVAATSAKLAALQAEAHRLGCVQPGARSDAFKPVSNRMGTGAPEMRPSQPGSRDGVSFKPGAPMVDPNPDRR